MQHAEPDGEDGCRGSHAYWQHPVFPGRPWDQENWIVQNETMVNERGGIFTGLALRRVLGKPFCVTEYGNSAPNTHASEGHLLRAAYASLQDWDYISAVAVLAPGQLGPPTDPQLLRHRPAPDENGHADPGRRHVPAGRCAPARELVVASVDKEREINVLRHGSPWELVHAGQAAWKRRHR